MYSPQALTKADLFSPLRIKQKGELVDDIVAHATDANDNPCSMKGKVRIDEKPCIFEDFPTESMRRPGVGKSGQEFWVGGVSAAAGSF